MPTRATVEGAAAVAFAVLGVTFAACIEPPPKIAAIPAGGISLRLFVFGATAQEVRQAFDAAKQTNKNFFLVREGGDGEVLVGLENDSPKCVQPTALCSYKIAIRIRDNQGKVVHSSTTTATANAERCADLCERAHNIMVVKVVESAVAALKSAGNEGDAAASDLTDAGTSEGVDAGADASSNATTASGAAAPTRPAVKKGAGKSTPVRTEPPPPKPEPAICTVAHGPHLPAEEAEKRAAQVEALKRLGVLDQDEYDCLRKAYLDRL